MNEIRRPIREADEIAAIRNIVMRHQMPPFVAAFDVLLSTVDGDPAVWIIFKTTEGPPHSIDARKARAVTSNHLVDAIHDDLREEVANRYPYFRFSDPAQNSAEEN